MYRVQERVENLHRVHFRLPSVPGQGTVHPVMAETPLRKYLSDSKTAAEEFASTHGFSPWSVRHWARGNKLPSLDSQLELEKATDGKVSPADWLNWEIERRSAASINQGAAA